MLTDNLAKEVADRKAADTALGGRIDAEASARETADTALGGRIDNAEAEISANSADLTGIKGLTYGNAHVAFLENNAGEYDSPALQEIAEQISNLSSGGGGGTPGPVSWFDVTDKPFNTVGTGLNTASESLSLDTSYLPIVSAGSGVTVMPTTDGNHTKYEISSTGGGGTGGITGDTTWAEMEV